jgi:hypothetical protein
MLQFAAVLLLTCLAGLTTSALGRERAIFAEFRQTMALRWLIWLFPLTYALPLCWRVGWRLFFPAPLGFVLFLPSLILAHRLRRRFERCGTDRTKPAERALGRVMTFGVMAIAGLLLPTAIYWLTPHGLRRHLAFF